MRVVRDTGPTMERALRTGAIQCPDCPGPLRPWGMARERVIRVGAAHNLVVRPRRARCAVCRATHVLLPDWLLTRRAYAAGVIWRALATHAAGLGYRRIALRLRVPETTVRDWLRAYRQPKQPGDGQPAGAGGPSEHSSPPPTSAPSALRRTSGRPPTNTGPPHTGHDRSSDRPP
jgi:hypothetical protein